MGQFHRMVVECPICIAALPQTRDKLNHWIGHTFRIATGDGACGYTWTCRCGPAEMYWDEDIQAVAGLAVHMLDRHYIAI